MALSGGSSGRTEAVVTCPGEIDDPNFPQQCSKLLNRLQRLLGYEDVNVVKCEPWNSVKITFDLPAEAAEKLSALAKTGDDVLREMGILSLQIQGGQIISMTVMSDEELRRSKSKSDTSSSLLVNLLQNKDNSSSDHGPLLPPDKKRRISSNPGGANFKSEDSSSTTATSSEGITTTHRSQLPKSASANTLKGSMLPPPPPVATTASISPASAGASGTVPSFEKSRQILINPNTGVLESGPSESSSEGETEPGEGTRTSPGAAAAAAADKALKLKLKLPNPPPSPLVSLKPPEGPKDDGPKLPKLILSMRDKTVKAKFSRKAGGSEDESDESCDTNNSSNSNSAEQRIKMLIAKRTLSLDTMTKANSKTVNHVIDTSGNNSSSKTEINQECSTKSVVAQHNNSSSSADRLNAWAKSLGVRVEKGAFTNNVRRHLDHDEKEISSKGKSEPQDVKATAQSTSAVAATVASVAPSVSPPKKTSNSGGESGSKDEEVTPTGAGGTPTCPTVNVFLNGPSSSLSKADSFTSSEQPSDMDSSSNGPPPHLPALPAEPPDSGTHQQGEDSGIESMDTLSEKSPNQGENPYPNEERLERELVKNAAASSPASTTSTDSTIAVQATPTTSVASVTPTPTTTQPQKVTTTSTSSSNSSSSSSSASHPAETSSNHHVAAPVNDELAQEEREEEEPKPVIKKIIPEEQKQQPEVAAAPILVNGHASNGTRVVPPPGSKMVPVKLVTVSAEGNVHLVRVSPVNTTNSDVGVVPSTRTAVIINSTTATPSLQLVSTPSTTTTTKEISSTVVLVGESASTKQSPVTPPNNSVQLGPSLSIMPVFDTPPAGHQSGSMSMKDVVDSINKKNSLIEAALSLTEQPQPLEIDVKKAAAPARPTRQPMPKRSPSMQTASDHSFVGGGSLLKPLLATTPSKEETSVVTVTPNHVGGEEENKTKRRRRDTDSSTKSDKSDISLLSIESSNSVTVTAVSNQSTTVIAAKKAKLAVEASKKAAAGNNSIIKARNVKGVSTPTSTANKVKKLEANNSVMVKKAIVGGRAENTRAKAKAKVSAVMASLPPSTTITPAPAVVNIDQEVSRRSVRQQTPTPGATNSRPTSARQQTPTRTTGPSTASATASGAAAKKQPANNAANSNSQVTKKAAPNSAAVGANAEDCKSKRLSTSPQGQTNSGSSSIATPTVATNAAALSSSTTATVVTSEKRMKTRSAKASSSTSDENFETKRRRLKIDS